MKCASLLLAVFSLPSRGQDNPEPPNILILLASDLRADALGCTGNATVRTPNLDAIAREGARLENCCTASPLSCPARAALLTGLYPHQTRVLDDTGSPDLRPDAATLPRALERAGYVTGFVGKAHLGGDPRRWGFRECPLRLPGAASRHRDPCLVAGDREETVPGDITTLFADAAASWIERHRADRWFLWLAFTAARAPLLLHPRHPYKPAEIDAPPLWPHREDFSDHDWAGYYSTISLMDEQVGRLDRRLRELGLHERTFLVFLSDAGLMMGSHGYSGRGVWFEESVRIPALLRWPARIRPGTRVWSAASSLDVVPTLLEAAGLPPPGKVEAVSLWPALRGEGTLRYYAYAEARLGREGTWQMVRAERLKYVLFSSGREHLYDLFSDPGERRDLATGARHLDDLDEMRSLLQRWREATTP